MAARVSGVAAEQSVPRRLLDTAGRAKMGLIHDAFDFVGHVPEDLPPLSREGTGARCRRALPGNPDDTRVNYKTTARRDGETRGPEACATRSPSRVWPVDDGASHAETSAVSAYQPR